LHVPFSPKTFEPAFERVQPETGHIHVGHDAGRIEPRENIAKLNGMFGKNTPRVVIFMKALQPLVAYRPNHF